MPRTATWLTPLPLCALALLLSALLAACEPESSRGTMGTETDREALVALYRATDGNNWTRNDNWLSDAPIGEWRGVRADHNGRAIELRLNDKQLSRGAARGGWATSPT